MGGAVVRLPKLSVGASQNLDPRVDIYFFYFDSRQKPGDWEEGCCNTGPPGLIASGEP